METKTRDILYQFPEVVSQARKILQISAENELVTRLTKIPAELSEGLFLAVFEELFILSPEKEPIRKLIKLFMAAGKDLSFMGSPIFSRKINSPNDYVTEGPLTFSNKRWKTDIEKEYLPLITSNYENTYRLPGIPMDIKKHIQGFVTGFDQKANKENRKGFLQEQKINMEKQRLFLIDQIRSLQEAVDENLSLEQLDNIYRNILLRRIRKIRESLPEIKEELKELSSSNLRKILETSVIELKEKLIMKIKNISRNEAVNINNSIEELAERLRILKNRERDFLIKEIQAYLPKSRVNSDWSVNELRQRLEAIKASMRERSFGKDE